MTWTATTAILLNYGRPRLNMKELAEVAEVVAAAHHSPPSAARRHFLYCPATSISFSVVAPKLGSASGVKSGQLATTRGLGFVSGKGGIDALQLVSRSAMPAILPEQINLIGIIMADRSIDMSGQKFNALRVIKRAGQNASGAAVWECQCDCGAIAYAARGHLIKGQKKSCGCGINSRAIKHRMSNTPEHRIWRGMIARCHVKTNNRFPLYGGRGILVCERWRESFLDFFHDVGPRPSAKHSLDRIDNNGNYEPCNCRWATQKEQCRNRRNNIRYAAHGKIMTVMEWAEFLQIPEVTIRKRISAGYPPEIVFSDRNVAHGSIVQSKRRRQSEQS